MHASQDGVDLGGLALPFQFVAPVPLTRRRALPARIFCTVASAVAYAGLAIAFVCVTMHLSVRPLCQRLHHLLDGVAGNQFLHQDGLLRAKPVRAADDLSTNTVNEYMRVERLGSRLTARIGT